MRGLNIIWLLANGGAVQFSSWTRRAKLFGTMGAPSRRERYRSHSSKNFPKTFRSKPNSKRTSFESTLRLSNVHWPSKSYMIFAPSRRVAMMRLHRNFSANRSVTLYVIRHVKSTATKWVLQGSKTFAMPCSSRNTRMTRKWLLRNLKPKR